MAGAVAPVPINRFPSIANRSGKNSCWNRWRCSSEAWTHRSDVRGRIRSANDVSMATVTDIGSLIERRDGFRGGRPVVAGTSVSVQRIAGWYKLGLSPEEIAENFGHVSLAQVHAALAYYHSNREEIEAYLRDDDAANTQLENRTDSDASS